MKILIIDDDATLRRLIATFMESRGWEAIEASNGREGFARARATLPDLVLCDFEMDLMNGHETLAALRGDESTASIPFILMTGATELAGMRPTMDRGADDYLPKPFGMQQLFHAVETRIERVARARRQAEQKLGALRRQVSLALPHELKTPLHGILGLAELLDEGLDSMSLEEIRSTVRDIHTSGERLRHLITNYVAYLELLLATSSPETAAVFTRGSTPDAAGLVAETSRRVARRQGREADLAIETGSGGPAMRAENLAHFTAELVDNACKFSTKGSPVRIAAGARDGRYRIEVQDHGRGLTAEQVRDIGAFVQFDRQRYEQQGVGLGLVLSRMLVELHGGNLTVESSPGSGTTVRVDLPAAS